MTARSSDLQKSKVLSALLAGDCEGSICVPCLWQMTEPCQHAAMSKIVSLPTRPPRLSGKLRSAIELRVTEGLSIAEACKRAGMSPQGFGKAMKRPAVRDHMQDVQRCFVLDTESKRALDKARAFEERST